jgi:hypothetical protein
MLLHTCVSRSIISDYVRTTYVGTYPFFKFIYIVVKNDFLLNLLIYIYKATKCNGEDQNQFPSDGYFGAVSVGLWDNGGACGRKYQIRCLSGPNRPCKPGIPIVVKIVDFCPTDPCPATMTLSDTAFNALSTSPDVKINVEYIQYVIYILPSTMHIYIYIWGLIGVFMFIKNTF